MTVTKHVGEKYNHDHTVTQVAALIRAEIKAAQKTGKLAKLPVSVKTHKYSMGCSIYVRVEGPAELFNADPDAGPRLSERGTELHDVLQAMIVEYVRSEQEPETDYNNANFHYFVTIGRA